MKLSMLSCPKCGRRWYMQIVGSSLTEFVGTFSSIRCITHKCTGKVRIHGIEIETHERSERKEDAQDA